MRTLIRFVRFLFVCAVLMAIIGGGFAGLTIWYFGRDLPDYQQLARYQPAITTRVLAGDGRLLAEYATEKRVFVPISAIPKQVIAAFLAAEDKNFYSHHGFDPIAMLRAAIIDISHWHSSRRPVGASTITQQVAKNMLLTSELSIERKIKEVLLATRIDDALPKDRILELYLNEIYLGNGAYGVAAAALAYFGKPLDALTLPEIAFLAGLPKGAQQLQPGEVPAGGAGTARLGHRPHGRERRRGRGAGRGRQGRPGDNAAPHRDRYRYSGLFRRGGAPRADCPVWREGGVRRRGSRCAPASIRRFKSPRTRRCAMGSLSTTAPMAAGAARSTTSNRAAIGPQ